MFNVAITRLCDFAQKAAAARVRRWPTHRPAGPSDRLLSAAQRAGARFMHPGVAAGMDRAKRKRSLALLHCVGRSRDDTPLHCTIYCSKMQKRGVCACSVGICTVQEYYKGIKGKDNKKTTARDCWNPGAQYSQSAVLDNRISKEIVSEGSFWPVGISYWGRFC